MNLACLRVTKVRRFQEPRTADFGKSMVPRASGLVAFWLKPCTWILVKEIVRARKLRPAPPLREERAGRHAMD